MGGVRGALEANRRPRGDLGRCRRYVRRDGQDRPREWLLASI